MSLSTRQKIETNRSGSISDDDFEMVDSPASGSDMSISTIDGKKNAIKMPISVTEDDKQDVSKTEVAPTKPKRIVGRSLLDPLVSMAQKNAAKFSQSHGPVFRAKLDSQDKNILYNTLTLGLPAEYRESMACSTCRKFIRQYGSLCVVADDGSLIPLFWPLGAKGVPPFWKQSVLDMVKLFKNRAVGEEFKIHRTKEDIRENRIPLLGTPLTGAWSHFWINFPRASIVYEPNSVNQNSEMSYEMLRRILTEHSAKVIARTYHIIHDQQLPYTVMHKAPIAYLQGVADKLEKANIKEPTKRRNLITKLAREGFIGCLSALRSGIIGYLLELAGEDIPFETMKTRWEHKANPLSYLRPTALPTAGNIESAQKIFEKLGYTENDLRRVFLTLDQVPRSSILWSPADEETDKTERFVPKCTTTPAKVIKAPNSAKPFQGLLQDIKNKPPKQKFENSDIPCNDISFRRFALRVLPNAVSVEYQVNDSVPGYFFTSGLPESKPIMNFHNEGSHTAAWYTYQKTPSSGNMNLAPGWVKVQSIVSFPHMWDEFNTAADGLDEQKTEKNFRFKRLGIRYLFVLEGARDIKYKVGLCLFPTLMRGELHGVRKTVEAFSNREMIEQPANESAQQVVGISVGTEQPKEKMPILRIRTASGQESKYKIIVFE